MWIFGIIFGMSRWFNIGGPCNSAKHYMLPAVERLPEVVSLIRKEQYFVVHAPRQCGKTTAFQALADEINAKGEMAALYVTVETVQEFPDPRDGLPRIADRIRLGASWVPDLFSGASIRELREACAGGDDSSQILTTLRVLSEKAGKPLIVFFDEIDCLSDGTLVSFLRQLLDGRIACKAPNTFPVSIALIGLRNIRDYKMRIRPEGQSTGEASPFNVITKAMTIRQFTEPEMRALYRQHTDETGQVFEEAALAKAWEYSQGQPYLVNALARWCVEEIHHEDFSQPVTGADMDEAKEKLIRERGTHLDSLMEKATDPRVRPIVEQVMLGGEFNRDFHQDDVQYCLDLGLLIDDNGTLKPANPIYMETLGRYLSYGSQQNVRMKVQENPWAKDDGLDMPGLMAAFQQFWRENAREDAVPFQYREAYPHLVLQAFLQRVINGGGQIVREMALGSERLDLGVHFRGAVYAVEVKKLAYYEKSHEKAYQQMCRYMDRLGVSEGWLVVADSDLTKPWDEKISSTDIPQGDKTIHLVRC